MVGLNVGFGRVDSGKNFNVMLKILCPFGVVYVICFFVRSKSQTPG